MTVADTHLEVQFDIFPDWSDVLVEPDGGMNFEKVDESRQKVDKGTAALAKRIRESKGKLRDGKPVKIIYADPIQAEPLHKHNSGIRMTIEIPIRLGVS